MLACLLVGGDKNRKNQYNCKFVCLFAVRNNREWERKREVRWKKTSSNMKQKGSYNTNWKISSLFVKEYEEETLCCCCSLREASSVCVWQACEMLCRCSRKHFIDPFSAQAVAGLTQQILQSCLLLALCPPSLSLPNTQSHTHTLSHAHTYIFYNIRL